MKFPSTPKKRPKLPKREYLRVKLTPSPKTPTVPHFYANIFVFNFQKNVPSANHEDFQARVEV